MKSQEIDQRTEGPESCQDKSLADALLNVAYLSKQSLFSILLYHELIYSFDSMTSAKYTILNWLSLLFKFTTI